MSKIWPWLILFGLGVVLLTVILEAACGKPSAPESRPSAPEAVANKPEQTPTLTGTTGLPRFAVQVGAFEKRARADELALQLSNRFQKPVLTTPTNAGNRTLYRVRILVDTKADADALVLTLFRDQNLKAWIVAVQ
ncbi:MAG: SPOR domain-containing protein [Candidatus Acidiferrales bacterium]